MWKIIMIVWIAYQIQWLLSWTISDIKHQAEYKHYYEMRQT